MTRIFTAIALAAFTALPAVAQDAETAPAQVIEMTQGNPDAKVEIFEYASYTCPHCATFHADQYAKLKENYIDTGKVKFTFRDVYFDRPGLWASMVARCGGEMRFFAIQGLIFEKQQEWIGDGNLAGIAERLRKVGKTAGLSDDQLDACMTDANKAQALVDWFEANAAEHNIKATPSLVINGETMGNMSYEKLAEIVDKKLAE